MKPLLCLVEPWQVETSSRATVRVADALNAEAFGLGGLQWLPGMVKRPQITVETMSLDLDGRVQAGRMSITLHGKFAMLGYKWTGAPITLWSCPGLEYESRLVEFTGEVTDQRLNLETGQLQLTAQVSTRLLDTDLLTLEFTGAGGETGDAEMRGALRPMGMGVVQGIEPVWFDKTRWIGQIDGYGNTLSVQRVLEGASSLGPSFGDFLTYAALAAAIDDETIPPGGWGTCIAEGLVGMGAPPAGIIGVDATFQYNRLGAMMERIMLTHADVPPEKIDSDALDALDLAVPYNAHFWVSEQRKVQGVIEAMCASANATPIITPQGMVTVSRGVTTAAVATLDRSGSIQPRVINWESAAPVSPFWQLKARVARPANVLTFDQVYYEDDLTDRGSYNPETVYRQGDIVWLPDGSSWLYVNESPEAGRYPPDNTPDYWYPLSGASGGGTSRAPLDDVPTSPPVGFIHYDAEHHQHRFEGYRLKIGNSPLYIGNSPLHGSGWVSVRDKSLEEIVNDLQALDDDGILTVTEKVVAISSDRALENIYQGVVAQGAALGYDTSAVTDARAVYIAIRDSLTPAWNDTSQPTNFYGTGWDAALDAYENAIARAQSDMAAITGITVIPPEAQVISTDAAGVPAAGELPRVISTTVKRGSNTITTDDTVQYSVAATGDLTVAVNNTQGSADKGKITISAGANGRIDLTVTVLGVEFVYPILVQGKVIDRRFGTDSSGGYLYEDGHVMTWRSITVGGNTTQFYSYGNGYVYADFAHAWVSGGEGGTNAQDNNPYVDYDNGGDTVSGCTITTARDNSVTTKLFSFGK